MEMHLPSALIVALLSGSVVVRCITRYVSLFDNLHNNVWLLAVSVSRFNSLIIYIGCVTHCLCCGSAL